MAKITSGRVVFSKTIQDAQFEPRRAEVELTFMVGEGEDVGEAVRAAGEEARAQAMALVGADGASGRARTKNERARRFKGRTDLDD